MKEAVERYSTRPELGEKLVLMNSQLCLQRGNVDGALSVLAKVRPDDANYQAARVKMAQIYLYEKHDKHRFSACYRNILDKNPSTKTFELLGDAYISIQEPEKAIEAYESAMRQNPKDFLLAEKIGDAYVKCHLYYKVT